MICYDFEWSIIFFLMWVISLYAMFQLGIYSENLKKRGKK